MLVRWTLSRNIQRQTRIISSYTKKNNREREIERGIARENLNWRPDYCEINTSVMQFCSDYFRKMKITIGNPIRWKSSKVCMGLCIWYACFSIRNRHCIPQNVWSFLFQWNSTEFQNISIRKPFECMFKYFLFYRSKIISTCIHLTN